MQFHAVGGANGQFFQAGAIRQSGVPGDGNFGQNVTEGTVESHGIDTSEMTFHWDRPFRAPQGYNLTLTCVKARVDDTIYNIYICSRNSSLQCSFQPGTRSRAVLCPA